MDIRFLTLAALLSSAPAWSLDLKGVELGKVATRAQLTESLGLEFGESHCRMHRDMPPDERAGTYRCMGVTRVEGVAVSVDVTFTAADAVESIVVDFSPGYFDQLAVASARKWGKPTTTHATLQNGFGAQFAEVMQVWNPDGGDVRLYAVNPIDVSHGLLTLKAHGDPAPDPSKSRL